MARAEVIRPFVEEAVSRYLGIARDQLRVMDDGTIPIRAGSTAVSVRLVDGEDDHPVLQVYAAVLHDVTLTPELLGKLNEINTGLTFARAFFAEGQLIIAMELLAEEVDEQQIEHACGLVSWAGDRWDGELRSAFGGETFFRDDAPGPSVEEPESDRPLPGYI